jgi:hypothetical protein
VQIFSKQTKSQTLIRLYLFWKNRIVWFGKPDGLVFVTLASCLIFFYLSPLMPFSPFSYFKTGWIFKSSSLAHSSVLLWNCQNRILFLTNRTIQFFQSYQIWSSTTDDSAAETNYPRHDVDAESCCRQCYRVILTTALPSQLGHNAMLLPRWRQKPRVHGDPAKDAKQLVHTTMHQRMESLR